jgi:hypothetical protein
MSSRMKGNRREEETNLVHVKLDVSHRHCLLQLSVVPGSTVDSLGNVFQYEVEVDLILLGLFIGKKEREETTSAGSTKGRKGNGARTLSPFE